MQSFQRNRHVLFLALVALKLLVSLISRLVACSARIVADRQTHRTTTVTLAAHARRGGETGELFSILNVHCDCYGYSSLPCLVLMIDPTTIILSV